jgi:PAS domain S-box-containing protein
MSQDKIDILERALLREKKARKQAERILEDKSRELYLLTQELKESNSKLEDTVSEKTNELEGVFDNLVDAYMLIDLSGNVIRMNDSASKLFGYDLKKESLNVAKLVYKEDSKYAYNAFAELIKKGSFTDYEARVNTKNKSVRLVHINSSVIFDKNNKPIGAQGIISDITKEREAEEALIESKNRLSTLIVNLDFAVLLEDENGEVTLSNQKFQDLFHADDKFLELIGSSSTEIFEDIKNLFEEPEKFVFGIDKIIREKLEIKGEEIVMKNGNILERDYVPIYIGDKYKGHMWSYKDVTLKRNYRHSLEAQKQKYSNIITNMNLGMMEVNTEGEILMVNQSFEKMSGYSKDELVGKIGKEVFSLSDVDLSTIEQENKLRKKGESNSYELKVTDKFGDDKFWFISGAPNYSVKGKMIGSIGIHLDITELKKLELQKENLLGELERSNEELQEYAHVVSHDLKSPLRSIYALVNWLKEDNKDKLGESSLKNIGLIENSLEKMERLISDILNYSIVTSNARKKNSLDLNQLINELRQVIFFPSHIELKLLNPLPIVVGDETRFQQLFQNLISNSILYIDKEVGLIEIDCIEKNFHYQFSVKDNGVGIKKENHKKIFKIFHSLEKRKESSGIGLSIVKKIVSLYGGEVWLESEYGKGTTFYFTIKK